MNDHLNVNVKLVTVLAIGFTTKIAINLADLVWDKYLINLFTKKTK